MEKPKNTIPQNNSENYTVEHPFALATETSEDYAIHNIGASISGIAQMDRYGYLLGEFYKKDPQRTVEKLEAQFAHFQKEADDLIAKHPKDKARINQDFLQVRDWLKIIMEKQTSEDQTALREIIQKMITQCEKRSKEI